MTDLKFHPKAFSLIWDMPRLTPAEHIAAVEKMIAEWDREKASMHPPDVYPCGCTRLKVVAGLCEHGSEKTEAAVDARGGIRTLRSA